MELWFFGGDLQQILPVVQHGNQSSIVKSCVHSSALWNQIQHLSLTINMLVLPEEIAFAEYCSHLEMEHLLYILIVAVHPEV